MIASTLLTFQNPDGPIDPGNLGSPPDTAFVPDPIRAGRAILMKKSAAGIRG